MSECKRLKLILICYVLLNYIVGFGITSKVTVSSLNLWNVMFSWDVRKERIAEMIRESRTDIVAFQEVRSDLDEKRNQITHLHKLLPEYEWALYKTANTVNKYKDNGRLVGWELEGLGLLSKFPVLEVIVQDLPNTRGPDTNKRIVLHVKIRLERKIVINIVVVHFSYHREQQCENSQAVLNFIQMKKLTNVIVLGDFNVYDDYQHPLDLFITQNKKNVCGITRNNKGSTQTMFKDAWKEKTKDPGFTFSNMPEPGYISRPDRILITQQFHIEDTWLSGNGKKYKTFYINSILYNRLRVLVFNSYNNFKGVTGYSCVQDCGPKGSCRCGNCVKGDNHNCDYCPECSNVVFIYLFICLVFLFCCVWLMLYSIVRILLIAARYNQDNIYAILGFKCCLFNAELHDLKLMPRSLRKFRHLSFFRFLDLPPLYLLCLSFMVGCSLLYLANIFFSDSLDNIYGVMDEETFPSDHLMLSTRLFIS